MDAPWDDETECEDPAETAYRQVAANDLWQRVLTLAVDGDVLRHEKHPVHVHPGLQHKLMVWVCEARRPRPQCPCGLYRLQWLPQRAGEGG